MEGKISVYRKRLQYACSQGKYSEILDLTKKILYIVPDDYQALIIAAETYMTINENNRAIKILDKMMELYGENNWNIMYCAARLKLQKFDEVGDIRPTQKLFKIQGLNTDKKYKICNLLRKNYMFRGDIGLSLKYFKRCIKYCTDYKQKQHEYTGFLFTLHYLHNIKAEHMYNEHKYFNRFFNKIPIYNHELSPAKKKLRIGYISPDLRYHAVVFFAYQMFKKYDKKYFEVYCYAKCKEDKISEGIRKNVDCWKNINNMSDKHIAQMIYDDKIDILFDLAGHSKNNCLAVLAYKPAPIQISGIGYFDTTGLETVDYFLTDTFCDERGRNDKYFSENLLYMPHSHLCYTPADVSLTPQKAPCSKNGYITFGSMNFLIKINSVVARVWQTILDKVPNSRLLLKDRMITTPFALEQLKKRWQRAGLDIDRVDFEPWSQDYLKSYYKIDIALDTFPYPGGATTCDALYMGVPVITLVGQKHGSRFGYSLLSNIGSMDDCIAYTPEDYIDKAVQLAQNGNRINFMHLFLREHMQLSVLMNGYAYMQDLEHKYFKIWKNYAGYEIERSFDDRLRSAEIYRQTYQYKQEYDILGGLVNRTSDNNNNLYQEMANCCIKLGHPKKASQYYLLAAKTSDNVCIQIKNYSAYLLSLLYYEKNLKKIYMEHKDYQQFFHNVKQFPYKKHYNSKIRVAYISADFRKHVMFSFYQAMLCTYDKSKFEIICYCLNKEDNDSEYLKRQVNEWYNLYGIPWGDIGQKIYRDNIDILVDLSGHTIGNALPVFAYRPASIQISGLGYIGPIGLSTIDYYLTDKYCCPSGLPDRYFSEKPLKLMNSQFCYTENVKLPISKGTPVLRNKFITFCSFNNYAKITDEVLIIWNKILEQVPGSIFILKNQTFVSNDVRQSFHTRLKKLAIKGEKFYLECADSLYMQRYLDVDIALDTFPYNGGGTTCEALFMGVPVISLSNGAYVSGIGNSILSNINMDELVVNNINDYIKKAVALANDLELLDLLHKNMRKIMLESSLMDKKLYMKNLEEKYIKLIEEMPDKKI
ncbi:O-linked N-acetylglucosamine transferase, SPINDLY family protein [Pectinatus frisingensis]|uniref:O-linked N-acetylglucosamine transferase, SPINDLY family protein n=1 Tax=Pectinatus frisingensis TaxID=865 RepID=UPI0015F523DF|nr:hypothetical protein [Pectinatus frisingensis]